MADDGDKIEIEITLADGTIATSFAKIKKQGEETADTIGGSFAKMTASVFSGQLLERAFEKALETAKEFFGEMISSARESEVAIQNLNIALGASGRYSEDASHQFQELADKMQRTTTVSDDTVLALEKLAITYTKNNTQALKLTETSVNLAAVTGQDVNGALTQLAGTLSGHAGRLEKLFPVLGTFTSAQLKAGAAVEYFNDRFAGAAAAQTNTFDGRMKQLTNSFDDFLKAVGKIITSSPAVVAVVKFLSEQMMHLADSFKGFQGQDLMKGPILSMTNFARLIVQYVGPVVETFFHGISTMAYSIETTIRGVIAGVAKLASVVANFVGKDSSLAKSIQEFSDGATDTFLKVAENTRNSFNSLGENFTATQAVDQFLEKMGYAVESAQPLKTAFAELGTGAGEVVTAVQSVGESFQIMFQNVKPAMTDFYNTSKKVFAEVGVTAIKALAGGVGAGMAQIGKALVKGENLFKAFASALLGALGQACIQMGATYILMGVARAFSSYGLDATAWGLISTGGAMSVLGGALMAMGDGVSGGGAAAGAAGAAAGGGGGGSMLVGGVDQSGQGPEKSLNDQRKSQITVAIHGDVLDSRESGLRIVELINDAFDTDGAKVRAS